MNDEEYVDVVYPLESISAIFALILLGCILGFVAGLGYSYKDILTLQQKEMIIKGNVHITPNNTGEVYLSGITINSTYQDTAIHLKSDGTFIGN
jgi:hypothetical protein